MIVKLLRLLAPVAVLVAAVGVVQAMMAARPEPEKVEEPQRLVSLYVDEVRAEAVTLSVRAQGEVSPKMEIELVAEVSGRIVAIADAFADGAGFEAGDVLLEIDDADYRLALTRAESQVAAAELSLAQALASASIKKQQWDRTNPGKTPTPLQVNAPQVTEARAALRAAEAELEGARRNLERTRIRAPFRGRVRERRVGLGQYVSTGLPLGRIFSTDTVEVVLPLTDRQLVELDLPMGFVAGASPAPKVRLSADVGDRHQEWAGHVARVSAAVDPATRLIHAVVEVRDPYGEAAGDGAPLAVGLFVDAEIEGVTERVAYVLPREALRSDDEVYVVGAGERLEIRTVEVLSTSAERVVVASGVRAGERVVTSTLPNAVEGMQVQTLTRLARL